MGLLHLYQLKTSDLELKELNLTDRKFSSTHVTQGIKPIKCLVNYGRSWLGWFTAGGDLVGGGCG